VASYLACHPDTPDAGKRLLEILDPDSLLSFRDFPLGSKLFGGIPRLVVKHGMASGDAFERWLDAGLEGRTFEGMSSTGDWSDSRLKLVATDVTTHRVLLLPADLTSSSLAGQATPIDPPAFPISKAARMSMSIPYLFQPVGLDFLGGPYGTPVRSTIVDGDTASTFPVWLFDRPSPSRPTIGVTLTGGSGVRGGVKKLRRLLPWPARTALQIFQTADDAWDPRFHTHSTRLRTFAVSATVLGPDGTPFAIDTTDFGLSKARQDALVENGRRAAIRFLDGFELADYVNTLHAQLGSASPAAPLTAWAGAPAPPETSLPELAALPA